MPNPTDPEDPKDPNDPNGPERDWIESLYSEGAVETPPGALDAGIRAAARQALEAPDEAATPWYRNSRRLATLATAASLVLAAMIGYYPEDRDTRAPLPDVSALVTDDPSRQEQAEGKRQPLEESRFEAPAAPGRNEAVGVVQAAPAEPAPPTAGSSAPGKVASAPAARISLEVPAAQPEADLSSETLREMSDQGLGAARKSVSLDALLPPDCGEPPGTAAGRRVDEDTQGWYLEVSDGDGSTFWRCIDGRWTRIPDPEGSGQEHPDPQDDQ